MKSCRFLTGLVYLLLPSAALSQSQNASRSKAGDDAENTPPIGRASTARTRRLWPKKATTFATRSTPSPAIEATTFANKSDDFRPAKLAAWLRPLALAFLLLLCTLPVLHAQSTTASLTGVVDDPSKAVIPHASITAINTQTGSKTQTFTNKEGQYVFPSLQTGNYRVEVDKQGFKGIIEAGLTLHVQDVLQLNFHMAVGSMSESVTVNAAAPTTETGTVSTVIGHEFIENMPLNGNDLTTLFELTPGTLLNAGGTPSAGGGFSVDGQRPTSNYVTVDGASANAYVPTIDGANNTGAGIATSASGGTNGILPVDAIEEYRMDTSTYTAENGRTPGGQIQVRTRSGTNQFHGTLFEDFRNQVLDATDWFVKYDGITQAQLRMNEFGGTLGGPVVIPHLFDGRNRLFFFVANDNLVLDQPNTSSQSEVPDASLLQGAYSPFSAWLAAFPVGNGGQIPGFSNYDYYNFSYPDLIRDHTTSVRLDGQLPRSIHAFFRANVAPSSSLEMLNPGELEGSQVNVSTYTGGLTIPIGTHMVNELTANRTIYNAGFLEYMTSLGGNSPNALKNNLPNGVSSSLDDFTFELYNFTGSGGAEAEASIGPDSRNKLNQWNVVDTFALHKGKNTLKFGADFLSRQSILRTYQNSYTVEVSTAANPPNTGSDLDTGLIDQLNTSEITSNPNISLSNTSLFANDDWKITSSLTLNAGVRWEFDPAAKIGSLGAFAFVGDNLSPLTFQAALSTKPLYQTVYDNFAPRFGFAWKPLLNSGMVIRGGAGIYFDTGQAATAADQADAGYPYQYTQNLSGVSYPSFNWATPGGTQVNVGAQSGLYLVDPHLVSPRTFEWSLTLDQAFGKSTKLTASYIGNDGEKLIGEEIYYNFPNSSGQYPVNTTYVEEYGNLFIVANQSHSNYQAFQAQLTSQIGRRLSALVSYTWEHAEDNGSSDFSSVGPAVPNPIANSANDIPQMFATAVHYAPDGLKGNHILQAVTGGWGLDTIARLQSASPITVTFNSPITSYNAYTSNADVVPGVSTVLHEHINNGTVVPGNKLLNWAAFTAPPTNSSGYQLRNGDSSTNGYRLFGLKQWDLAASRTWQVWRELNLNFRVDAYNLLNTANFAAVANNWTSSNVSSFGRARATYSGFYGQSGGTVGTTGVQQSTFQNGGPRELQLSMKLKF